MEKIWFRGNPRLWYRPDLENHPELIPLEGQEVVLPKGSTLSKVIPGVISAGRLLMGLSLYQEPESHLTVTMRSPGRLHGMV